MLSGRNQEILEEEEELVNGNTEIDSRQTKPAVDIPNLPALVSNLSDKLVNEKDIILLGDFCFPPSEKGTRQLPRFCHIL